MRVPGAGGDQPRQAAAGGRNVGCLVRAGPSQQHGVWRLWYVVVADGLRQADLPAELERMYPSRPAQRVPKTVERSAVSVEVAAADGTAFVACAEQARSPREETRETWIVVEKHGIPAGLKKELFRPVGDFAIRVFPGLEVVPNGIAHAEPGFVDHAGRQCGRETRCEDPRRAPCLPVGRIGPIGKVVPLPIPLDRPPGIGLVFLIEMGIDFEVELLSLDVRISDIRGRRSETLVELIPHPADLRCVQPVASLEIVGARHHRQILLHEPGSVRGLPARIPGGRAARQNGGPSRAVGLRERRHLKSVGIDLQIPEDAETDQAPSSVQQWILGGGKRIPPEIDRGPRGGAGCGIRVLWGPSVEVAEDALARGIGQDKTVDDLARADDVPVEERKKECLVPLDRPAITDCGLMVILPVRNRRLPAPGGRVDIVVVVPGIRVQSAVANAPDRGAIELVGPRACRDLNLPVAAAHLRIHRSRDEPDLPDHVGVHDSRCENAVLITAVADAHAVANRIDRIRTDSGEGIVVQSRASSAQPEARKSVDQVKHVATYDG